MTWRNYLRQQFPEGDAWTAHGWVVEWLHGNDRPEYVRVLCWGWTSKNALQITTELTVTKAARRPWDTPDMKPGLTTFVWDEYYE